MCGIAGKFRFASSTPVDPDLLRRMGECLRHRGPDDGGVYVDEERRVGLAHRRLSIIDLSTGAQPMSDEQGMIWIVFNGEIYNYRELRHQLQERHRFRTTSDTEVIIHAYKEWGEQSFHHLNGIFAFALYDRSTSTLILVRDHLGVKPLYYSVARGNLLFGSEIKAILLHPSVRRTIDFAAFNSFLTLRYNPSPRTLFEGIHKLRAGHYLKVGLGGEPDVRPYWAYHPATNRDITEKEALQEYRRLLSLAVRRQMISDVPVGLLLSGGVDSAAIGYLMQEAVGGTFPTFTVGFPGKGEYNELDDARVTAQHIGSEHYDLIISRREYLDFFPRSFRYTEEPIAEPTIPALFYISRLASRHVKVVLAGQGADEPLAGYPRYVGERLIERYGWLMRVPAVRRIADLVPRNERLKRTIYAAQYREEIDRFLAIYTIFTPSQIAQLVRDDIKKHLVNEDRALLERTHAAASGLADPLARMLYLDARTTLSDDLLLFGDKMTMANSLEMRVPYLDLDFIVFLESLPSSMKLSGRTGKYIHKKALEGWLPREFMQRRKRPFATPMDEWLQEGLYQTGRRLLNAPDAASRNYFNLTYINQILERHRRREENHQRRIFSLLSFELWHRTFFEGRSVSDDVLSP